MKFTERKIFTSIIWCNGSYHVSKLKKKFVGLYYCDDIIDLYLMVYITSGTDQFDDADKAIQNQVNKPETTKVISIVYYRCTGLAKLKMF